MGKTARWFRGLLGGKKETSTAAAGGDGGGVTDSVKNPVKKKKKWSFIRSFKDKDLTTSTATSVNNNNNNNSNGRRKGSYRESNCSSSTTSYSYIDGIEVDPNKHAIAVAAATAAVAEHAVAAAQAAAAVVKLTSSGRSTTTAYVSISSSSGLRREDWAALKIQSAFRGYLARRALQALKGLVKLQALVRGHIVRKKTAETLKCMQSLVRVQARARTGRSHSHVPEYRHHPNLKSSLSHQPDPATPEKYENRIRSKSTRHNRQSPLKRNSSNCTGGDMVDQERVQVGRNWLDQWMDGNSWNRETLIKNGPLDDEKSDKILEVDPGKPHFSSSKLKNSFYSQQTVNQDRNSYSTTGMDSPSKDSTTAQLSAPSTSSGEVQSINHRRFPRVVENAVFCTAENSPQFYSASSRHGSERRGPFTPAKSEGSRSFLSGYSDYPNYMSNTESSRAKVRSQSAPKQRLEFEKSTSMKRYLAHGFGEVRSSSTSRGSALQANFTSKAYPGSGRLDRLGMPVRSSQ